MLWRNETDWNNSEELLQLFPQMDIQLCLARRNTPRNEIQDEIQDE
jgi:hypothetical protein